jgi:hypothetical protein
VDVNGTGDLGTEDSDRTRATQRLRQRAALDSRNAGMAYDPGYESCRKNAKRTCNAIIHQSHQPLAEQGPGQDRSRFFHHGILESTAPWTVTYACEQHAQCHQT